MLMVSKIKAAMRYFEAIDVQRKRLVEAQIDLAERLCD